MMKTILLFLLCLYTAAAFAQQPQQEENAALLKKNKVKSLEFYWVYPLDMINGTKGRIYKKVFFDREGRITQTNLYNDSAKVYHTARHEYNAKGLLAKQVTVYENDTTIMHYSYSDKGADTMRYKGGKENVSGMEIKSYNPQGLIISKRFTRNGETVQLDSTLYDKYGRKIQFTDYNPDMSIGSWTNYWYNEKGWLDKEDTYAGHNCKRSMELKYYYDERGNLITKKVVSDNVKITYPVHSYDEQNRLVRKEYYSADSTRHDVEELVWKDTLLQERKVTYHHLPKTMNSKYSYHANGLQDEVKVISEEPRPETYEKMVYNEKGELVEKAYYAGNEKGSYYLYKYDDHGRRTEERWFSGEYKRAELYTYAEDGKLISKKLIAPAIYNAPKGHRYRNEDKDGMDTTETVFVYQKDKLVAEYDYKETRDKPHCYLQYSPPYNIFPEDWRGSRCGFWFSVSDTLEHKREANDTVIKLKLHVMNNLGFDTVGVCTRTIAISKGDTVITDTDPRGLELLRVEQQHGVYRIKHITASYFYRSGMEIKAQHIKHLGVPYDTLFYNKSGEKIKQVTQKLGGPLEHRTWEYKDKMLVKEAYSSQGYKDGPNTYLYKFNDAGEKTEMRVYNAKGELGRIEKYKWTNGKLVEKRNVYEPGELIYRYRYEYY